LDNGTYRLRAIDGSTTAVVYFSSAQDYEYPLINRISV